MHVLERPLVDLTTLTGVESLYRPGFTDPHKHQLAGQLGDMVAYAQTIRFCQYSYPSLSLMQGTGGRAFLKLVGRAISQFEWIRI